jgi:thioesterase domain-containing protein
MSTAHERTAIARAEFFLALAEQCTPEQRTEFEAFLEAAIVFARAALHRLKSEFESHSSWKAWFAQLKGNPSVEFFREHRDFLLKEASPKVGQIISFNPVATAAQLYYFEDPSVTATATVRKHLQSYAKTLQDSEACFRK